MSTGAKQVIYNALIATLNPEDEVIIPAPYWVSYPDMVLLGSGVPVIAESFEKDNFKISPKELESKITKKTTILHGQRGKESSLGLPADAHGQRAFKYL